MPETDLILLLEKAKSGHRDSRNQLINLYRPFILKAAARVCGRFICMGEDDEASIALMAFDEAIDGYDKSKGHSFLGFAETVIRRRLIDYYRKETRNVGIPMSSLDDTARDVLSGAEAAAASAEYDLDLETMERREEIRLYSEALQVFGIKFLDLVKASPKHESARRRAMEVAVLIAQSEELSRYLYQKKALPLKELAARCSLSRKTLERQRKYIIAATVILVNDFKYLKEYIKKIL